MLPSGVVPVGIGGSSELKGAVGEGQEIECGVGGGRGDVDGAVEECPVAVVLQAVGEKMDAENIAVPGGSGGQMVLDDSSGVGLESDVEKDRRRLGGTASKSAVGSGRGRHCLVPESSIVALKPGGGSEGQTNL